MTTLKLVLKVIFGDYGKLFIPDNHTDAYKQHRLALWRMKYHWGLLLESLGFRQPS